MTKITLLLAIAFTFAIVVACQSTDEDDGSLLHGVPTADIDGSTGSLKLEPAPGDAKPSIDSETAEQLAKDGARSGDVLETVLVNYTDLAKEPPTTVLAWAVNFEPGTVNAAPPMGCGSNCPTGAITIYDFALIDAQTGEFILSANVSGPPPTP